MSVDSVSVNKEREVPIGMWCEPVKALVSEK